MKHSKKILALLLTFTMCVTMASPVLAADNSRGGRWGWGGGSSNSSSLGDIWDWVTGWGKPSKPEKPETPETPDNGDNDSSPELTLIEGRETVANGDMLRAETYAVDAPTALAEVEYVYTKVESNPTWWQLTSTDETKVTDYYYQDTDGQYYQVTVSRTYGRLGFANWGYTYKLTANNKTLAEFSGKQADCESNGPNADVILYTRTEKPVEPPVDPPVEDKPLVKYFPITMFDYDEEAYNAPMYDEEFTEALTEWSGLYVGGASSHKYTYVTGNKSYGGVIDGKTVHLEKVTTIESGSQYVLVSACEGANGKSDNNIYVGVGLNGDNVISVTNNQNGQYANPIDGAAVWTVTENGGSYNFQNANGRYLTIGTSVGTNQNPQDISVSPYTGTNSDPDYKNTVVLHSGSSYMNKNLGYNHQVGTGFSVYGTSASDGNAFYLYKVVDGTKEISEEKEKDINFAPYNRWTGYLHQYDSTNQRYNGGNDVYQGLAQDTLDANGQIQFNYKDRGLFTEKEFDGKKVYTNVGLPFKYDSATQRYSFNAKEMGAWFKGAPASNVNLHYSEVPQFLTAGTNDVDNTKVIENGAGWFPFNDSTGKTARDLYLTYTDSLGNKNTSTVKGIDVGADGSTPNHLFGMSASIDFTMTPDGMMKDGKTPIDFHFSGDDDVWVFIDGKLVLDIGGIHNRTNGHINFADGKWSVQQIDGSLANDVNNGATTEGDLWETLGTDLTTFAAQETHTLSVFYLERGKGASNCEISFNLPMKDYVNVTKNATKDNKGSNMTEDEQATVDNMDFTYKIYRNGAPYANEVYTILNATTGNAIGSGHTNADGQFTIRNNQTARFTTSFNSEIEERWHVEETELHPAFKSDDVEWTSTSVTINGNKTGSSKGLISDDVYVIGSEEASGKINWVCENILNAERPNPSLMTDIDRIVLDYGLSVEIDPLANDVKRADSVEIVGINGELIDQETEEPKDYLGFTDGANNNGVYTTDFGTVTINKDKASAQKDCKGTLTYTLDKQLTDVEEITYIAKVTGKVEKTPDIPGDDLVEKTIYVKGTVYVIPATSMYYEENFSDMVTYKNGDWQTVGTADDEYQEPGVVKTTTDSPYGSDAAYLNDTGDSNGTSRYISTATAANAFKYTFTGTGTSFFVRTTNNSGYIRVTVKDEAGDKVDEVIIDTRFLNESGKTLYNIPVYTLDNLDYGTYTVSVSIAKNSSYTSYGTDFWLDGIRVQNPMKPDSANYDIAETAYSDDGEANVNIETLRDKIIDAADFDENGDLILGDGFATLTDINGNITSAADYESIGPKQEVYLAGAGASDEVTNGQKISFTLEQWDMNHKLYLGLKAPMGTATVKINGKELTVSNTPDCYYNMTDGGYITVDADGNAKIEIEAVSGVVSVTNIKTTGAVKFEIIPGDDVSGDDSEDVEITVD